MATLRPMHKKLIIQLIYENGDSLSSLNKQDCEHIIDRVLNDGLANKHNIITSDDILEVMDVLITWFALNHYNILERNITKRNDELEPKKMSKENTEYEPDYRNENIGSEEKIDCNIKKAPIIYFHRNY